MLKTNFRLRKSYDFARVYKKGQTVYCQNIIAKYFKNNFRHPRLGFVISNKISNKATARNRLKRLLREAASLCLKEFFSEKNYDIIISLKKILVGKATLLIFYEDLKQCLKKLP